MAGDAELGFGVLHASAQGDRSPAGCVGEPGVAHVNQEVHACAHRIAAEYGLAQFERLGVLPRTVGRRSDEAPIKVSYTAWQGSCTLENLAEGRANLRRLRSGI